MLHRIIPQERHHIITQVVIVEVTIHPVLGGYNTTHSVAAVGHPHHASHHQAHHQSGASGQMLMSSTAQWNSQPNNRTSGVDRTASSVEHIRGSNERTSGGYRR